MNKIELKEAIAYWEEFKSEIPETFEKYYPEDGKEQERFTDVALAALREKAERDKGCMRCNHGKGFFTGNAWIYIGSDGSLSIRTSQKTIVDFPKNTISRCPWCGRKLKEVQA